MAHLLCEQDVDGAVAAQTQSKLEALLQLEQGVPVALGSGRQALPYKVHALAHSSRLTSESWSAAAEHINATFTWVGDLGERSVNKFRSNLKNMFGTWVDEEFVNADDVPDEAVLVFLRRPSLRLQRWHLQRGVNLHAGWYPQQYFFDKSVGGFRH